MPASRCQRNHRALVVLTQTLRWVDIDSMARGQVIHMGCDGVFQYCGVRTRTWKLRLARQALQPSGRHRTRCSSMLDCHHRVTSSRLRWESQGPINRDALQFLSEWGSWRLVETTGDVRESSFLFQQISIVVQRWLHDVFIDDNRPE